jgi:hypothetical protein
MTEGAEARWNKAGKLEWQSRRYENSRLHEFLRHSICRLYSSIQRAMEARASSKG